MTTHGSCLCGAVRFVFEEAAGPFEICHCKRCRKLSGAQGMPAISVLSNGYRMTQGRELITSYSAPILYGPPAYQSQFCSKCGSPLPTPDPGEQCVEIPAGLLDDDPRWLPDKHIFTEFVPSWDRISDDLPQYDMKRLILHREARVLPDDFELRTHYDDVQGT